MNCTTEYNSSSRFSSGVPDSTSANRERSPLITRLVFASQFLMRWPSSRMRSEEHTSELQSRLHLVCRLLLEKKKKRNKSSHIGPTSNIIAQFVTYTSHGDGAQHHGTHS